MRIFSALYNKVLTWASYPKASYYLAALSFFEAFCFPIPPDFMLAPMGLAKPNQVWRYASITTIFSALGGIIGYTIGIFFFNLIYPYLAKLGYQSTYLQVADWFKLWGFWLTLFCGLTPVPYKFFTLAAGATHIPFLPFIFGSLVGRGIRFFLLSSLILKKGERVKDFLFRYIDQMGWVSVALVVLVCLVLNFKKISIHL